MSRIVTPTAMINVMSDDMNDNDNDSDETDHDDDDDKDIVWVSYAPDGETIAGMGPEDIIVDDDETAKESEKAKNPEEVIDDVINDSAKVPAAIDEASAAALTAKVIYKADLSGAMDTEDPIAGPSHAAGSSNAAKPSAVTKLMKKLSKMKSKKTKAETQVKSLAKGTGYSSLHQSGWDVKA